jgi:hypothetical protein
MTLFEKLQDIIGLGWEVKFSSFAFQLEITVGREANDGVRHERISALPLRDHFYESRIVDCIDWSISEIDKQIDQYGDSRTVLPKRKCYDCGTEYYSEGRCPECFG